LCGIPASGKTTFAEKLMSELSKEQDVKIVSTDAWRDESYISEFKPEKEQVVRKKALEETQSFLLDGFSVIHDDTNYYSSMRHELFDLANENDCVFVVVHIATPLDIALQWNDTRTSVIPSAVIEKIHERMDIPGEKYAWDKAILTINVQTANVEAEIANIRRFIHTSEPASSQVQSVSGPSEKYDEFTRKIVSEFLKDNPSLRNNPDVSLVRKVVLKEALKFRTPFNRVRPALWRKLERLLALQS
ncbi:MAG: AAA family ATPase, partial [Candidatus Thorarchaeota archaeon]